MDKSAIEQIQQGTSIPALIKHLDGKKTQTPCVVLPNDAGVTSLEQFMAHASRYRLKFNTTSYGDFIDYCREFDAEGAACFISEDAMSAASIFDLGNIATPGHKEHRAKLGLPSTPAFDALLDITRGRPLSQKEAADFIEDWADCITARTNEGKDMAAPAAAHSLRNITIEQAKSFSSSVGDFSESMSALEKIEAQNQEKIPAFMEFKCVPYRELKERVFEIRVSLLTGEHKPTISLRIIRLETIRESMAQEFREKLQEAFKDLKLSAYIGEV